MHDKVSSIVFIIPYFGKLPTYFEPWLISVSYNSTVDFIVFTDDESDFDYPTNVKRVLCSFEEIKQKVQNNFDFDVCIDYPYKLCDYRPAYGEIFSDYIKSYDFWGFCDIDLIFGNIRKFVTEDILNDNIRIFSSGSMSIYKNTNEVNKLYKLTSDGCMNYKDVYASSTLMAFDEVAMHMGGGTAVILKKNGYNVYNPKEFFLSADDFKAKLYNKKIGYFYVLYKDGGVFMCTKDGKYEKLYFHFHLKKKYCQVASPLNRNCFYYISPGKFENEITDKYKSEIIIIGVRNIFKRIYVLMGEPQWKWIKKLLK